MSASLVAIREQVPPDVAVNVVPEIAHGPEATANLTAPVPVPPVVVIDENGNAVQAHIDCPAVPISVA